MHYCRDVSGPMNMKIKKNFFKVKTFRTFNYFSKFLIVSEQWIFSVNIFFRNDIISTQKLSFWANRSLFISFLKKIFTEKLHCSETIRNFEEEKKWPKSSDLKKDFWKFSWSLDHWHHDNNALKMPYIWEVFKP